jgi:siroheme synthase
LSDVLVLYMAGRNLGAIAARLLHGGRDPADAVALIEDATRPGQTVYVTTLAVAADQTVSVAPTLIVIGPVVALRDHLRVLQQTAPMIVASDQQQIQAVG